MPTIDAVLARGACSAPDRVAVREWATGKHLSYRQLDHAVSAFAAWARGLGLRTGQSVAIHLPNSADFLIAQFGSFRAGGVATYVNYRLSTAEALRQITLCQARIVVTTHAKAEALRDEGGLRDVIYALVDGGMPLGHELARIVAGPAALDYRAEADQLEDRDALIRYTSGSTGAPKGVIVSHRAWLIRAVSMLAEELRIVPHSTTLLLGPLSHQAGLFVIPTFLRHGTLLVLDKFDAGSVADVLAREPVSCSQVVPTILGMLLNDARSREALRVSGVERLVYGGSPIRQAVLDEALELLPHTEFVQGYGSHEAGAISYLDGAAHRDPRLRASAGRPFLAAQVRIRPEGDDAYGEIQVKAPWLPHARLTEAGRQPIAEEWSGTGDLGEIVDGYIFLRDRMNDVIISGGFNVYPAEVETVIVAHPAVSDVAIVSAPDPTWGERVVAFVVPRAGRALDLADLKTHCQGVLAGYKIPKDIHVVQEIPLNPNGKPDRRRLSDPLWAGQARRIN
jgi:acyl-CoA synthetase (AMP-forming)/AMP-acid ligase II